MTWYKLRINYNQKKIEKISSLFTCVSSEDVCKCAHMCAHICVCVSEDNLWSWFSPSIVWILDGELGSSTSAKTSNKESVISALTGPRQLDYLQFETSLGSLVSSWLAWATKWYPVSKLTKRREGRGKGKGVGGQGERIWMYEWKQNKKLQAPYWPSQSHNMKVYGVKPETPLTLWESHYIKKGKIYRKPCEVMQIQL